MAKNTLEKTERRKRRLKMFFVNAAAVIGAVSLFGLLGFVYKTQKEVTCWSLDISIESIHGDSFISETSIRKLILSGGDSIVGHPVRDINIGALYGAVAAQPSVKKAHVYTTVDGRCVVKITQREPIARILNEDGSGFYLDKDGVSMPLSLLHTAHVPVFTGFLNEKMKLTSFFSAESPDSTSTKLDDIFVLVRFIQDNQFLNAQVEHVFVNNDGGFEIIPRVGNHRIVIGDVNHLDIKFKKLMAFYANTLQSRDINVYRKINLTFDDQVVCVK